MATALGSSSQASLNLDLVFPECDNESEVFRQRFRQFQWKEAAGPHEAFNKLRELCCQWLKPKLRSMEQVVDLLVMEQYLTILPQEQETRVTEQCPESSERVVSLVEDFQTDFELPEPQFDTQEMLLEDLAEVGIQEIPQNIHLEVLPLQAVGPVPEAPDAEAWIPQAELQELSYGAAGEGQPFVDTGYPQPQPDSKEPSVKDLQNCKEVERLLQLFDFEIDGNALLDPNLPEDTEQPKYQLENPSEQLPGHHTLPVHDQKPFSGEKAERCNEEEPLSSRAHEQKCAQKKTHQCTQCGKDFVSRKVLNAHLKIHLGELPHECLECGKRFLRRSNLQRHVRVHTREKPYKCSVCEKQFTQVSHLIEHQKTFSGQEVCTCPECRMRFCSRKMFMQHQKIHTNGKPHKCDSCGKRFRRQKDLKLHHMVHTAERPFMCECCGKRYRHRSSLVYHLRNH